MNGFVDYLNSTNNVGGNSTGSLAETQVKSKYYDAIKVERNLGTYITKCVQEGQHKAFILTGHAGDGKTSILVQVLKDLNLLEAGEGLQVQRTYDNFAYIKDMSEIPSNKQIEALRYALEAPENGKTSLLISNTGPLLKTFEALVKSKRQQDGKEFILEDKLNLQSKLLKQLDVNKDTTLEVENYEFVLVNIARVDNVPFAINIMEKMIAPELWEPCSECKHAGNCPIKNNRDLVAKQFERVSKFVQSYYRFLYENDKRMTIRQMVGQISYALTGNLTCARIVGKSLFSYNFANLFFGYKGLKKARDAAQIKGIADIQNLCLDQKALGVDYALFVSHDYSYFTPEIQTTLHLLSQKYKRHYQVSDEDQRQNRKEQEEEVGLRKAIRRFFLMYSLSDTGAEVDQIMDEIFGDFFADYVELISSKQSKIVLKKMQNVVFDALYMKNTGYLPEGKMELPLTLRREDDVFQNVMIVLGMVPKNSLEIVQKKATNKFEDVSPKYELYLKLRGTEFKLSLPMIIYFNNMINGAISSNNNPALTHGIAQLDTLLLEQYGDERPETEEDCELTVIINTTHGQKTERFDFEELTLSID